MREIITKYDGECLKCGKDLPQGTLIIYEKSMGVFCVGCEPTDSEEIRKYRQVKADRKANKYDEWAGKREKKANAILEHTSHFTNDHAFNTQPGHIPMRARIIKQEEKAFEHQDKAGDFRDKADSLRKVRVKGDAAKKRQQERELLDKIIHVGDTVESVFFGTCVITKKNRKTYTVKCNHSGHILRDDKTFFRPSPEAVAAYRESQELIG